MPEFPIDWTEVTGNIETEVSKDEIQESLDRYKELLKNEKVKLSLVSAIDPDIQNDVNKLSTAKALSVLKEYVQDWEEEGSRPMYSLYTPKHLSLIVARLNSYVVSDQDSE